jgi:diaminopimelate epimerase
MAVRDCNMKKSIGADGVLVIETSPTIGLRMRLFNRDGSEGEMCGNGARCFALYAFKENIAERKMKFSTLAGVIEAEVIDNNTVIVNMGNTSIKHKISDHTIVIEGKKILYNYAVVGVPHVVIYASQNNIHTLEDMKKIGYTIDHNRILFPEGTNVNFVKILNNNRINVITYERGVNDITDSCGTGSCASVVFTALKYNFKSPVTVESIGGESIVYFEISQDLDNCSLLLQGQARYCADISILI